VVGISIWSRAGHTPPFYTPYVGLLEFLFHSIIALGIIVWLLELQRRSVHRARSKLERLRLHDPTTDLPNRELLLEHIREMMRLPDARIMVLSLGINRYSVLTRALGWQRTERVIRRIADRIRNHLDPGFALGRINERDFVVVGPAPPDQERIRTCAESLLAEIMHPLVLDGEEIFISACAGISFYPDDGNDPEPLLENSQHALVQSARIGRDVTLYHHVAHDLPGDSEATLRFETELRRALDHRQFEMHYQAIVRVTDQRVMGYEALMRWRHPTNGLLPPDQFLDQAAGIGLLDTLEQLAMSKALIQVAEWNQASDNNLFVAVNVSAQRFLAPTLVAETLAECHRLGVDPNRLEMEITENTALQNLDAAAHRIAELHGAGIRVSLDDFGTGFSSLGNLLKLKVARIKLDRVFVEDIACDPRQRELVAAMIELGHRLEIDVVAEGIEHPEQLRFLAKHRCDFIQGFLLHRPAPARNCRFEVQLEA
ncbi:MAG: putative bifunctional diguanylate cyclase/phosphodiesterase, partial [Wenzhouxiangellaceae bacterium]